MPTSLDAKSFKALKNKAAKVAKLPDEGFIRHKDEEHMFVRPWIATNSGDFVVTPGLSEPLALRPASSVTYFKNKYFMSGVIHLPAGAETRHETGIDGVHVSHQHILVELTSSWTTATILACLSARYRRLSSL